MKSFGEYIRKIREERDLPLRKVAAALDIDTSILSKIERNERTAKKGMIPILSNILEKPEKELEIEFIQAVIENNLGDLKYLKDGLKEILKTL